jgi:hypothetical protein
MAPEHGHGDQCPEESKSAMERNCYKQSLAANAEQSVGLPEARALALTCDLCQHRMQAVADLLLLTR